MNRKIKTWAYAILLLNIIVAGIGIAKLLFDVFTGNGNAQDGLLFQNLHLTAYSTDSFMDFFNSIQYGRKPYTAGVIYPPLINLIYAIFGGGGFRTALKHRVHVHTGHRYKALWH